MLVLLALAWGATAALGQAIPKTIKGFAVPDYDENGVLRSKIFGGLAELQSDGRIKITDLKIQMYREGLLDATIWAAQCFFDRKTRNVVSDTFVRLEKGPMVITGVGLRWDGGRQNLEILSDVQVMLRDVQIWKKQGIKL